MTTPVHPALGHNTSQGPYLVVNNGLSGPNHFTTNGTSHMQGLNISTPELSSGQLSNRKRKTPEFYAPKGMYEQGWYPTGTPGEAEAQSNNDGRKAKRNKEGKIPRPPNCWILFRAAHHNQVAQNNPGIKNKDICK
jgi:hypothetical protein